MQQNNNSTESEIHESQVHAAIYCRISRDREGAGLGVDRQEADCRALAIRMNWEVTRVYIDNDISAASGALRPQYREMLEDVRAGRIDGIIAWHTDRLHRRAVELEEFVSLAESHNLKVQTVTAGTVDLSTASGRMVARMLAAAAAHEVDHAKDRIRRAKSQAAERGEYRGGMRPFGYEKDGVTVRKSEAKLVLDATRAIIAGRSLRSIEKEWEAAGVVSTLGRKINYNGIRDLLLRPRNAGLIAKGLPGRKGRGAKEPDWSFENDVIAEAQWPAIVPLEEWRAFVSIVSDPARRTTHKRELHWLGSGIYVCGRDECGSKLGVAPHGGTASRPWGRYYLYRCREQAHLTVRQDKTDEYVRSVIVELVRDPRILAAMHPQQPDLTEVRDERNRLAARLSSFETDYAMGRITGQQLQKATAAVEAELQRVDQHLSKVLARSSSASVLGAADPGQAFLDAPIDIQRAVLKSIMKVTVVPQTRRGAAWSPDRLLIEPIGPVD